MREISAETALDYLWDTGRVPRGAWGDVRELSGGVSNIVLLVRLSDRPPFVIKQSRERLRVAMEWRARLERIWTEEAALELLGSILPNGTVPRVLFNDRANYLFAMTCAPDEAVTWKSRLLADDVDVTIASRVGDVLGTIHSRAPRQHSLFEPLSDTSMFDELRVDPYYRTTARVHTDLARQIERLITSMDLPFHERTLVLGDFSPKNILVYSGELVLLDFECAHAGDPSFDLGFVLTHLVLKAIRVALSSPASAMSYFAMTSTFWRAYLSQTCLDAASESELVARSIRHTGACSLARVDGKSPVEYLDGRGSAIARAFGRAVLQVEPATWDDLLELLQDAIDGNELWQP
jgi:5-methylthioribose kinase